MEIFVFLLIGILYFCLAVVASLVKNINIIISLVCTFIFGLVGFLVLCFIPKKKETKY